jgi:hypothetical protein
MACRLCLDSWGTTTCVVSSRPACTESAEEPAAYARPIQQLANMANTSKDTINVTPQAPGASPAALTGMIRPLPQIGGPTLFAGTPLPRR